MKKKIIIFIVLIIVIVTALLFVFIRPETGIQPLNTWLIKQGITDSKNEEENTSEEEEETQNKKKWKELFKDEKEEKSEEEMKKIQEEFLPVIKEYHKTVFNFDNKTKDYTNILLTYYVDEDYKYSTDREIVPKLHPSFKRHKTVSRFKGFEPDYFTLKEYDEETAVITGMTQVKFSDDIIDEYDYSVQTEMILEKINGEWKIVQNNYSNIYKTSTLKKEHTNDGLGITYSGWRAGFFSFQ